MNIDLKIMEKKNISSFKGDDKYKNYLSVLFFEAVDW